MIANPWGHGLRVWLAMSLAIYGAFWLQLGSPASSALTVAILAQPRRGQALSRAVYRFGGTVVGGIASVALVSCFGQDEILLLGAFTLWLGACVFVAGYLAGDRAYGAVLCGYTVAMIAVANIDRPQNVFELSVDRVAAVVMGIAAITLVNVTFSSPPVFAGLDRNIRAAHDAILEFVRRTLQGGTVETGRLPALISQLVALRADVAVVATESADGRHRAAGARSAIAGMSAMLTTSRWLAETEGQGACDPSAIRGLVLSIIDRRESPVADGKDAVIAEDPSDNTELPKVRARANASALIQAHGLVEEGLSSLRNGTRPSRDEMLPVHRDLPAVARDALRIMVAFGISAFVLINSGWTTTSIALSLIATLCALSATTPSPALFAKGAVIALPPAVLAAATVRFLVFDGTQDFPGFMLAIAPFVFFFCYLGVRRTTVGIGLVGNIYLASLLSPTNVQNFDLQNFLNQVVLVIVTVTAVFLTSRLVIPVGPSRRLGWSVASARANLAERVNGVCRTPGEQRARSDDQIAQFAAAFAAGGESPTGTTLPDMVFIADLATALAGAHEAMRGLAGDPGVAGIRREAMAAMRSADPERLSHAATRMLGVKGSDTAGRELVLRASSELATAASLLEATESLPEPQKSNRKRGIRSVIEQARSQKSKFSKLLGYVATAIIILAAGVGGLAILDVYVTAPWTRDGRVRVQVVSVAPRISGQILDVKVTDNQLVQRGDLLYVIDPFDYRTSLDSAVADVAGLEADLADKQASNNRRKALTTISTSVEEKQKFETSFRIAETSLASARSRHSQAEANLQRTEVRSPVTGYVTNLLLRPGDYATTGSVNISVIDTDSYWIDGYFEETKLSRLRVGDPAQVKLMGYAEPIEGVVDSITRGISSPQAAPSSQGLPEIDAVYTWVRLAQRVPIRIRITRVPPEVPLIAGMTCTITIVEPADRQSGWLVDLRRRLAI